MKIVRYLRLAGLVGLTALASAYAPDSAPARHAGVRVTVFKDANCGCCKSWIDHLRKHGFDAVGRDTSDLAGVKRVGRVPERLQSCHTAFVNGYVVEGHVPASDVERLIRDAPKIQGIAVPGMPMGSPGMEIGARKDRYDVIAFNRDGSTSVFASH